MKKKKKDFEGALVRSEGKKRDNFFSRFIYV
jgi:hypothetical protein